MPLQLFQSKTLSTQKKEYQPLIQAGLDTLQPLYETLKQHHATLGHPSDMEHAITMTHAILASAQAQITTVNTQKREVCLKQMNQTIPYIQSLNTLLDYQSELNRLYSDCVRVLGRQHFHPLLQFLRAHKKQVDTTQTKALRDADDKLLIWLHRMPLDSQRMTHLKTFLPLLQQLSDYQQQADNVRARGYTNAADAIDWQVQALEQSLVTHWEQCLSPNSEVNPSDHQQQLLIDVKAVLGCPQWFPAQFSPSEPHWIKEGYQQRDVIHQHRGQLWSWVQTIEHGMNAIIRFVSDLPLLGDWVNQSHLQITPDTRSEQLANSIEATTTQLTTRKTP